MVEYSPALAAWQTGPLGRAVVAAEAQLLAEICDDVFGLELLQIGSWGRGRELLNTSRVRRQTMIAAAAPAGQSPDIVASAAGLPISSSTIDVVVLPHSLEIEPDPRAVLREAERVLVGEGQLIVLGFRPWSLWGLRAAASRTGYPPGVGRLLSERRLRDWLALLGFEVTAARHYLHVAPREPRDPCPSALGMLRRGLFNPLPAGAYLLKARKRVYAPTPLRLRRREHTPLVGSLVNPPA
ncbi:MAG TPA: methyltransferase domain-containing protein [Steroidobacteraceae bacterium]|jgi:SAM-dependent methyltransferase|nr:methyltransferase domain-containing protein [Steroidobacteraceae bacterium]